MEFCAPVLLVTEVKIVTVLVCETDLYEVDVDVELKKRCLLNVVEWQSTLRVTLFSKIY